MYTKVPAEWSNQDKMSYIERQIIVYSIMYYNMDQSCITDKEYDELSKQMVSLMADTESFKQSQYYYAFKDFDGTTGYDLPYKLNDKDKEFLTNFAANIRFGVKSELAAKESNKTRTK